MEPVMPPKRSVARFSNHSMCPLHVEVNDSEEESCDSGEEEEVDADGGGMTDEDADKETEDSPDGCSPPVSPALASEGSATPATAAATPSVTASSSANNASDESKDCSMDGSATADLAAAAKHASGCVWLGVRLSEAMSSEGSVADCLTSACAVLEHRPPGLVVDLCQLVGVHSILLLICRGERDGEAALSTRFRDALLTMSATYDLKLTDSNGNSALHVLAQSVNLSATTWAGKLFAMFVEQGASINGRNSVGQTPLHMCASALEGKAKAVRFLLSQGADLNAQDDEGDTALHLAIRRQVRSLIIDLFDPRELHVEIDYSLRNKKGHSILDCAVLTCDAHPESAAASAIADMIYHQTRTGTAGKLPRAT